MDPPLSWLLQRFSIITPVWLTVSTCNLGATTGLQPFNWHHGFVLQSRSVPYMTTVFLTITLQGTYRFIWLIYTQNCQETFFFNDSGKHSFIPGRLSDRSSLFTDDGPVKTRMNDRSLEWWLKRQRACHIDMKIWVLFPEPGQRRRVFVTPVLGIWSHLAPWGSLASQPGSLGKCGASESLCCNPNKMDGT